MTQLVIGTALGFMVGQGVLYGVRHFVGWLQRAELPMRMRALAPPGRAIVGGLIKYAAPIGASAALVTLGAWAVGDYLAAKSARAAASATVSHSATAAPLADRHGSSDDAALAAASSDTPAAATAAADVDPYSDPDFKVHHRPRRAGDPLSLKETIVLRSESRARADLLRETQQHLQRSQYDCEAADRADKYLKAGLDVWGFAAWQLKYFPLDNYRGATLAQCRDIKSVVAPALDLQSTVAQQNHS
jgi:hypothetical protein